MSYSEFHQGQSDGGLSGVVVGIVTDNKDPEKMGRVKLTFPWRDADDESFWARIATPMAGSGRGTYFLPEVNDEVLVAFDSGDIHHPYVLGSLWNGVDLPPQDNANGKNDVRQIRSRSGHEVVLNDSDSEGGLRLATSAGHNIVLNDESGSETISIVNANGQGKIEIDAQGAITISGGTHVSVSAKELELKGDGNISVEAGGELKLKGSLIQLNL